MSDPEAFEALGRGDFKAAIPLLDKASREAGYASDILNHAYTLALYRAGETTRLADVAFQVGNAILGADPALAMDYFQRALFAGLDAARVRRIGEIHEEWAEPSRRSQSQAQSQGPIRVVAHVVGSLGPAHPSSKYASEYVRMLSTSLKEHDVQSTIFTTEWASSWFFNSTVTSDSAAAGTVIATTEGDFVERAAKVAAAIRATGAQVAFYHANLCEQITARVAAMRPAPVQVNVNHDSEMDADLFDGYIHLSKAALRSTRFTGHPAEWIPPASNIESRLHSQESVSRQSLGIESASSVSATFGTLGKIASPGYLRMLIEILKRFPKHFHLFAGEGNVKAMRAALHAESVLARVRFLGQMADVAPLFEAVDVYFAPFAHSDARFILEAMGAGKPVVGLRNETVTASRSVAELVGISELTAVGEAGYVDLADRLIRDPQLRARYSGAVRDRFRAEYDPSVLGARYLRFLETLLVRV
jgi:glycosyltransferase involved in cell wall biosynthesis